MFTSLSSIVELVPQSMVSAAPGDGHMLLFWDGGAAPTGWSCVSCSPGEDFYQRFPRGNNVYGGTGGAATHTHTSTDAIGVASGSPTGESRSGTQTSTQSHSHTASVTKSTESNLPAYRQLNIIRSDTNGEPGILPASAIAIFDTTVPAGWTRYSAQDGDYIRGESAVGVTGGSNTHSHSLSVTIGAASGGTHASRNGGSQTTVAAAGHTHSASGSTDTVSNEPPYIEVILGQISADGSPPNGMLAMWDDDEPSNWAKQSGLGGDFDQVFFKGAASYGATGGSTTHSHADTSLISSGPSATTNARTGSSAATDSHSHTVSVSNYSNENHIPPYIDVIIAKRVPQPDFEQSAYRFYRNIDGTDVGAPLAAQDSTATTPRQGTIFRMRIAVHVNSANLVVNGKNFKLQVASRSGTCDTSFIGETYADVSPSSGDIRYANNSIPNDGDALIDNANDPGHGGDLVINQTYVEANNFTNSVALVADGEDALWDFSLVDFSAAASSNYCFRVVESDGTPLNTYTRIPEIITDDGNGHMIVLFDGATIPAGWRCVSCTAGEDFYQRFFRGEADYGATGGAASHSHSVSSTVNNSGINTIENQGGTGVATATHTHTFDPSVSNEDILPPYRQLKVIRANSSGVVDLPAGAIVFFDAAVPAGWTRYSAQDGNYVRGEDSVGVVGGSLTHSHAISGTLATSVGSGSARTNGSTQTSASDNHTHTVNGSTTAVNHEPPFIETILGQTASTVAAPVGTILIWDNTIPVTWTNVSESGQPFHQRFIKGASVYGATGGAATHNHADVTIASSGPSATGDHRTGGGNASGSHSHDIDITSWSAESNLPPYIGVIFGRLGSVNLPPNAPTNLDQIRTSDSTSISVGGWANSNEVRFEADVTDADDPDDLQLCVEVEQVGTAFDSTDTQCGSTVTYTGSAVTASVTISGLTDTSSYHWQARVKDSGGAFSNYVSFGGNIEADSDFVMDSTSPAGSVFDGTSTGVDVDFNNGSLDSLSANWSFTDASSGVDTFEYSIGTTIGGTDIMGWTSVGTSTAVTASSLVLETSVVYYFNVRVLDIADNINEVSSDGQFVAPSLTFSTNTGSGIVFSNLNAGNGYTDTTTTTLTTSTNARNGYEIRAYTTGLLENSFLDIINDFSGGTYATPDTWQGGDTGFGYTSSDTLVDGVNRFNAPTCPGGGSGGSCFAPFSQTAPGDIVADNPGPVSGSPINDEEFTITHRTTTDANQNAGEYQTTVIFQAVANY